LWNVSKDISRYSSLLNQSKVPLSIMLENLVNDECASVYEVSIIFLYYKDKVIRVGNRKSEVGLRAFEGDEVYDEPADLVIPVSRDGDEIQWFRIEDGSNVGSKSIVIPMNAKKVVLEFFVSSHGDHCEKLDF